MDIRAEMTAIRTRIASAGVSMLRVCAEAGIDKAQPSRWELHAQMPRMDTWDKFTRAVDRLVPK